MSRRTCTVLALLVLLPALLALRPAPPAGPGAVEAMHRELFAAIDAGDARGAAAFLASMPKSEQEGFQREPWLAFPVAGTVTSARGADAAGELERFAREWGAEAGAWTTRIVRSQADCFAPELSFAILEIERARKGAKQPETRRYLWSSLVRHQDGEWKLFHAHVSPRADAAR